MWACAMTPTSAPGEHDVCDLLSDLHHSERALKSPQFR